MVQKTIRDKKGQYAGSIGDGKTSIPTPQDTPPAAANPDDLKPGDPGYDTMFALYQRRAAEALGVTVENTTWTADEYKDAVARATHAAETYYDSDVLSMSDAEYDDLVEQIEAFEAANPEETIPHGLSSAVAAGTSSGGDVPHPVPMLSLAKVKNDEEAMIEFINPIVANGDEVVVEPKMDGMAIRAEYVDGRLVRLVTRGDGTQGEDVTSQYLNINGEPINGLPAELDSDFTGNVFGETFMNAEDFEQSNEARMAAGKPAFANPRNAVAGSLRREDSTYAVHMSFAAYGAALENEQYPTHTLAMAALEQRGFQTAQSLMPGYTANMSAGKTSAADAISSIRLLHSERDSLGYPIDGAVVSVNSYAAREAMGVGTRAPKSALAFKYEAVQKTSYVRDIELNIGRTGNLTMRVLIDPVEIDGSVVQRATIHNPSWMEAQNISIGSKILVEKAGDVIPRVTGGLTTEENASIPKWRPPTGCPQCGKPWDKSNLVWRCTGGCGAAAGISYFAGRDQADIDGMSSAISNALVEAGKIEDFGDLYSLSVADIADTPMGTTESGAIRRIGNTVAQKLYDQIQKSKEQDPAKLLAGIGLRSTGRSLSRRLINHFGSLEAIRNATIEQLAEVDGIGSGKAATIHAELAEKATVIDKLVAAGVKTEKEVSNEAVSPDELPLVGQTVVITGAMTGPLASIKRNDMNALVETKGGKSSGSVSANTTLLVCGEEGSAKFLKAQALGIKIVTPEEFASMIGHL